MKNLIILLIIILISLNKSYAQNTIECEKIVAKTYNSIGEKNADKIQQYLSDDFTISGHKGEIAKVILKQLISQLNDSVINFEKVSEEKKEDLTLTYKANFTNLGEQIGMFVFDKDNKIKELELIKIKTVVKSQGDTKYEKNMNPYFNIPFKYADKLILVKAIINGVEENFLFDSGAPFLILNSKYSENTLTGQQTLSSAQGAGGSISGMSVEKIENFDFNGIKFSNQEIMTMDLSHLEEESNIKIRGLIGYEVIKDYDILFNYEKKTLTFLQPEETEKYIADNYKNFTKDEVQLEMQSHIPVIYGEINGKKYAIGFDSGAEANLINDVYVNELKSNFSKLKTSELIGADRNINIVQSGKLKSIKFGNSIFKNSKTMFGKMSHLNESYKIKLDGIIGYEIFSKQPTLLSYINKKIIFLKK